MEGTLEDKVNCNKRGLLGITASTFSDLPLGFTPATRIRIIVLNDSDIFLTETVEVAA
jgi:hypothetical protein